MRLDGRAGRLWPARPLGARPTKATHEAAGSAFHARARRVGMRVLFLAGSPRAESATRRIVRRGYDYAARRHADAELDLLDLHETPIDMFRGFGLDYSDATRQAVERLTAADVVIVGSPVYNGSYSAAVKTLFEHTPYDALKGHVAAFMLTAGGGKSFLQVRTHLEQLMTYYQVLVVPQAAYATAGELDAGIPDDVEDRIHRVVDCAVRLRHALEASAAPAAGRDALSARR